MGWREEGREGMRVTWTYKPQLHKNRRMSGKREKAKIGWSKAGCRSLGGKARVGRRKEGRKERNEGNLDILAASLSWLSLRSLAIPATPRHFLHRRPRLIPPS